MLHVVTADEAGQRTDVVVAHLSGRSRGLVARALARGDVRVNGSAAKAGHPVIEGDVLEFEVAAAPPVVAFAETIHVPIVYEDDDVVVVDKPAGMITHPAHAARSGTLVNALLGHLGSSLPGDAVRPGLVHRLDRDTSGLLVVAKNEAALSALGKAMKARNIKREYRGLVQGVPAHRRGTIDGPIGRDPSNRLKFAIVAQGKPAITHYEVRAAFPKHAELVFVLETGRTHQIRVHLAAMGHPLLNDRLYGRADPRVALPGQALHAWRLAFAHPRTGEPLSFEAELPAAYAAARDVLAGE